MLGPGNALRVCATIRTGGLGRHQLVLSRLRDIGRDADQSLPPCSRWGDAQTGNQGMPWSADGAAFADMVSQLRPASAAETDTEASSAWAFLGPSCGQFWGSRSRSLETRAPGRHVGASGGRDAASWAGQS
jgi:hypothetical protein